jgi:hypothetical protein
MRPHAFTAERRDASWPKSATPCAGSAKVSFLMVRFSRRVGLTARDRGAGVSLRGRDVWAGTRRAVASGGRALAGEPDGQLMPGRRSADGHPWGTWAGSLNPPSSSGSARHGALPDLGQAPSSSLPLSALTVSAGLRPPLARARRVQAARQHSTRATLQRAASTGARSSSRVIAPHAFSSDLTLWPPDGCARTSWQSGGLKAPRNGVRRARVRRRDDALGAELLRPQSFAAHIGSA